MSEEVTIAKMVTLEPDAPIEIPKLFLEALQTRDSKSAVMILAPSTRIIRIIPTTGSEVVKIAIEIGELTPDFLKDMGSVFARNKIKTLYSTGLCFTRDKCVYEGYIDKAEITVDIAQLQTDISQLEGVNNVNIVELKAE